VVLYGGQVYENRLGGPLQDDMSMDWDESTGVTRYNLAVANTLAKLQSKLQLVEQQLEKEEVNTKAEARKERDTTTQQRDGETAEHMDSRVGDGSGRDVAIEKRRHKQRDLSAYGDLDYRSALLMEEEFVWVRSSLLDGSVSPSRHLCPAPLTLRMN
jgi:hypothetical protein